MPVDYDVVIMTDLRFPGGSSASTLEEIRAQHSSGLRTGVYHKPCSTILMKRPFNKAIAESILAGECTLLNLNCEPAAKTNVLLVRHPGVVHPPVKSMPNIEAEKVVLVINHPPVNPQGRVDYLLPFVVKTLRDQYKREPIVFPIGPLIRNAVLEFYDSTIALQDADWSNVFDLDRFGSLAERAPPHGRPLRIGRHSRPGREKWPDTAEDIRTAYLADSEHDVRILGGSKIPEEILGYKPKNWTVFDFGSLDIVAFLSSIDVFVYFHHPNWIEAFGRVIAEAMASGLPTILPHHFEPLFGEGAIYASPRRVHSVVQELSDIAAYQKASRRARTFVQENFGPAVHIRRMMNLISSRSLLPAKAIHESP